MSPLVPKILPLVQLKARCERRLRRGHCWVYSNEIDIERSNFKSLPVGQMATVVSAGGDVLGSGYFNPHALLCGRLYSRDGDRHFNRELIGERLSQALAWRESCYREPFYRLVYGDGDGLPGFVVDRYADVFSVQVTTAGAMAVLDEFIAVLIDILAPKGILLRNDSVNETEQLEPSTRVLYGDVPEMVDIVENGVSFKVPVMSGQKTGWFYDHRESRASLARYVAGKRVLDVYSYLGAWGLVALNAGAASLHCIDRSELAVKISAASAASLGYQEQFTAIKSPAIDALKALIKAGQQFDIVILDPPSFIKRRKDMRNGAKAYHHINQLAVKLLSKHGLLVSASCSLHMSRDALTEIVSTAANKMSRKASIIYNGGLGADHPVDAAITEMDYLTTLFARIE